MSDKYINYLKKYYKVGIIIFIIFFFLLLNKVECKEPVTDIIIPVKEEVKEEKNETYIYIDIKGEVETPGVYKMKETDRIIDAIIKSGGLKVEANTTNINLSKKLIDEMMIYIPNKSEEEKCPIIIEEENSKININKADITKLTTIPGIGESKANDIITYRNENGNFKSIDDIKNVKGIGETTFNNIKDYITV